MMLRLPAMYAPFAVAVRHDVDEYLFRAALP